MKKEIEFVRLMTEKLKTQGDVTEDEATYIFILAMVIHAYDTADYLSERRYWNDFKNKFNFLEISEAINEWYEEVFSRIDKRGNFIASIPSLAISPPNRHYGRNYACCVTKMIDELQSKGFILQKIATTSDQLKANDQMVNWLKENVPLSFDIMYHESGDISFARFGVLGLLPVYERREVEEKKLQELSKYDIPFLHSKGVTGIKNYSFLYSVACPVEYKNILDAVVDGMPIPEKPPEKKSMHTPKDVEYINSLTSRLSFQDITEEEADDLYLLFKMYQALKIAALKGSESLRRGMKEAAEPGLDALFSWYKAVEKELKKNKRGNFVYTLPSDLDMNLYQLRKPIERCLERLPKEPSLVVTRSEDQFPIKDTFLDTKCVTLKGLSSENTSYQSSRYGFFARNGINLDEWKPVWQSDIYTGSSILDQTIASPTIGKLRFAEQSLGIKQIVIDDAVAVKEKNREKMLEVLSLSNSKIMEIADILFQKELNEIRAKKKELPRTPENAKELDALDRMENMLKRDGILLEHIIKGAEIAYKAQKAREEYLDEGGWMEIDR